MTESDYEARNGNGMLIILWLCFLFVAKVLPTIVHLFTKRNCSVREKEPPMSSNIVEKK